MNQAEKIFAPSRFETGSRAPLYARVKKLVRDAVVAGDLQVGDTIPSERDVALMLDVSRVTVRTAFTELAAEGVAAGFSCDEHEVHGHFWGGASEAA